MRELTLLETGYLAGLLLLSLTLPLLMSLHGPREVLAKRYCWRTVWLGQALGAFAGLAVLASAILAPYAATIGVLSYFGCSFKLCRQIRAASSA